MDIVYEQKIFFLLLGFFIHKFFFFSFIHKQIWYNYYIDILILCCRLSFLKFF